jgi:oxygen-dependent protoporphyrinogen oxidase
LLSFFLAKKWRRTPPVAVKRELTKIPRGPISAPENGMGEWVAALTKHLEKRLGDRFQKSKVLSNIENEKNLIIAVPASDAAQLIKNEQTQELVSALQKIKYAPLITATVFVRAEDLEVKPSGLGVLMPRVEGRKSLGILYNSGAFDHRTKDLSTVSMTVMLGGSGHAEILDRSDADVEALVVSELREIFGLKNDPLEVHLHRWKSAVPTYNKHLLDTWSLAQASWCSKPGRVLFGNYTGQVSLRGMLELASHLGD